MKTATKRITMAGLVAACALTMFSGVALLKETHVYADSDTAVADSHYHYDHLTVGEGENAQEYVLAKKFYQAIGKMHADGDFKDGVIDYSLTDNGLATSEEIEKWVVNGDLTIPKAFSAARDAYRTDHPELFYIDFYKITISAARANGVYTAYIDSGREASLYYDNGFNTPETVNTAIGDFNARINEIVAEMNRREEQDTYTERNAYLAKETSRYLAEEIEYDYVAYENKNDSNYIAAAYINTAYGGLVEGKAVCGGYSTAYKVIMDKLGIPCITVNGYTNNKDENGKNSASNVYHAWNYVYLNAPKKVAATADGAEDGAWYSVDVTWNSSAANKYRFSLLSASRDEEIHVNDGVISSSGYKLTYPALSELNYGSSAETNGLQASVEYTHDGGIDDFGKPRQKLSVSVSYNGKSAKRLLEEDNLYLAIRYSDYRENPSTGKMELTWTDWFSLEVFRQFAKRGGTLDPNCVTDNDIQTTYNDNTSVYHTQFAVFDVKPTRASPNSNPNATLGFDPVTQSYYFFYFSNDALSNTNPVEAGKVLVNESYGTYTPAPYIQQDNQQATVISDGMRDPKITDKVVMAEDKAFVIEVTYNEELHVLDSTSPIEISFVSDHPNTKDYAKFFPVNEKGDLVELVQRPKNSGDPTLVYNTLRFKFAPSLMYEHDQEGYTFTFNNVGSTKQVAVIENGVQTGTRTSNKLPNPAYYLFGRLVVACPAYFNYDGRLYIDCCAAPTLLTNSDLSAMDFKDEDGNSTFSENERSQMMLVAEKANDETVGTMLDEISNHDGINVTSDDIKKTETYDIRLQMCNKYPTIPDGSYVKIGLGFPEGYGPNDEGVTFKLFHRKHIGGDEYIIEEIPCVVTQFGIVATVTSFSPYMVAVVDADKATDKNVFASIEGKGGKLTKEDGKIRTVKEGESYTYTVLPDKGYQLYSVTLNGQNVMDRVSEKGGKLTLTYDELQANNELEIKYIAEAAVARYADKNAEIVAPAKVVVSTEGSTSVVTNHMDIVPKTVTADSSNTALIVGVSVGVAVAVIAIAVAVTVFMLKRKQKGANGKKA